MKYSDLTIVIPSIGRESIIRLIKSVPKECKLYIGFDGVSPSETKKLLDKIKDIHNVDWWFSVDNHSAGQTKQQLIDRVYTDWFIIMDDDDWLLDGFIDRVIEVLNVHLDVNWVSTHYTKDKVKLSFDFVDKVIPSEFSKLYWDWSYGNERTETYTLTHVYPCSEVVMNTKAFKKFGVKFELDFLDDVIPVTSFLSTHVGLLHEGFGIGYEDTLESVSCSSKNPMDRPAFNIVIQDVIKRIIQSDLRDNLWTRVLANLLENTKYRYHKYGKSN